MIEIVTAAKGKGGGIAAPAVVDREQGPVPVVDARDVAVHTAGHARAVRSRAGGGRAMLDVKGRARVIRALKLKPGVRVCGVVGRAADAARTMTR